MYLHLLKFILFVCLNHSNQIIDVTNVLELLGGAVVVLECYGVVACSVLLFFLDSDIF